MLSLKARSSLVLAAALLALGHGQVAQAGSPAPAPRPAQQARTASSDPQLLTFGVQAASRTKTDGRPHFSYSVVPGAQVTDYLAVSNYSSAPVSLHLYAGDAFTNPDGGFDLTSSRDRPRDVGAWSRIGNPNVTLAPRTRSILPFRITVPANASPGDHTGGIIASLSTTQRDRKGDVVTVEHRLAERVYLRVPGALRPGLSVVRLDGAYAGTLNPFGRGTATVRYRVTNTGNVRLGARIDATVSNLLGSRRAGSAREVPELLPGSSLSFEAAAGKVVPLLRAGAHVVVHPLALTGSGDRAVPEARAASGFWTIPWPLIALLAVLGLTVAAARRRASSRPPAAHAAPRRRRPVPATSSHVEVS
jgi:hypothetical protein